MRLIRLAGIVAMSAMVACGSAGEEDATGTDGWEVGENGEGSGASGTAENGEPECVPDVCVVLDMYAHCVEDFPPTGDNLATAASVERSCDDDDGECCEQGYYMSPEAAACIAGMDAPLELKYHLGYGAPIWQLVSDTTITEVHAANGSVLSERERPVAS
jgi:hypothetical protein